jgi:eukaryotic-like serine/threonine-protein kinase
MSTLIRCPHGHQYEVPQAEAPGPCPVCGAAAGSPTVAAAGSPPSPVGQTEAAAAAAPTEALQGKATGTADGGNLRPPEDATVVAGGPQSVSTRPKQPSALASPPTPGYEILGLLGQGGMGVVYKARQVGLGRVVALKMLPGGTAADASALGRFRAEVEAVARLRHPNVVQIYEVGEAGGRPYFSMELVEGGSLAQRLARGLPTPRESAGLLEALARAVHYAHERGVVHRDLKPGNILLDSDGAPRITDFGLARHLHADTGDPHGHTRTGDILGTPGYMAPEQAAGRTREAGPPADIYALGAILYECLTGRAPFAGASAWQTVHNVLREEPAPPSRARPGVPRDLETVCLKCLEKDPARRYASAEDLAEDLRAFLAGESIRARPAGPGERLRRWARRRPTAAVLVAVGAVAVLGVLVGAWSHSPLAAGGVAVLCLLAGAGWYSARLHAALKEVRRQQELAERGVERLNLLLETTRRLIGVTDPGELLRVLGETTALLTNAERATIFLLDAERGELWSKVAVGDEVGEIRVPLGKGIAGVAAATGETINLKDPYADPRFNPEIDRRTGYTTRSLLTVPLAGADGKVVGVFQVLNKRAGAFGPDDVEMLHALAASAARAVGHAGHADPEARTELSG